MNVLIVCHQRMSKAFSRPHAFAKQLSSRGHNVTLMVIADQARLRIAEYTISGIRVIETPDLLMGRARSGWCPWGTARRTANLIADRTPCDIIHAFETRPATIYPILARQLIRPVPLVTDWNDWWGRGGLIKEQRPRWWQILFGKFETYYEEAFRSAASGLTVISKALLERAVTLGVPRDRILWIRTGAPTDFFSPVDKANARARLGLPPVGVPILGFAAVDVLSDVNILRETLVRVRMRLPNAMLISTGVYSEEIATLAAQNGVSSAVKQFGLVPREDLSLYLGAADVLCTPLADTVANRGRWPNKIGDYCAMGRPVLTNPVGDVTQFISETEAGVLAAFDPGAMASAVLPLLQTPQLLAEHAVRARRAADTVLNWDVVIPMLERVLQKKSSFGTAMPRRV